MVNEYTDPRDTLRRLDPSGFVNSHTTKAGRVKIQPDRIRTRLGRIGCVLLIGDPANFGSKRLKRLAHHYGSFDYVTLNCGWKIDLFLLGWRALANG